MERATFDLSGSVALVTGGGSGLGRGLALGLARAGAAVAIAGRRVERLEAAAGTIHAAGGRALACPLDVTALDQHAPAVERVVEELGGLDILVNCAGVGVRVRAIEMTEEEWDHTLDTNLKGAFFLSQAAARHMGKAGGGRIINVGSLTSRVGLSYVSQYTASKAAIVAVTQNLAIEWAPLGITVNAIGPGWFRTELNENLFRNEAWVEFMMERIPLKRVGVPEDLVGVTLLLASDAGSYITGQFFVVDGGVLAGFERPWFD